MGGSRGWIERAMAASAFGAAFGAAVRSTAAIGAASAARSAVRHSWSATTTTSASGGPVPLRATTILGLRKGNEVVVIGDGQVTKGDYICKVNVCKVRKIGDSGVIGGFAGTTADALTLFERLETKLEEYPGQLKRAAVELTKDWRSDKYLRRLDASMLVADKTDILEISGHGDVLDQTHGVMAIGSGGPYALCAALALIDVPDNPMTATEIAEKAMGIAAQTCIYTNDNFTIEKLTIGDDDDDDEEEKEEEGEGDGAADS